MTGVDADNTPGNGYEITYAYDADGVRVSVTQNGSTTTYLHDHQNPTGYAKPIEEKIDGLLARSYVVGLVAESQHNVASTQTITLLHDAHGSTRAILNAVTAAVVQRFAYDAFGKTISGGGVNLTAADASLTTWLFAGDGQYDPASAFTYHLARWRNGQAFISTDPIRRYSREVHNRYFYVNANPIMGIDPSGLVEFSFSNLLTGISIATALNALVGGAIGGATGGPRGIVGGAFGSATTTAVGLSLASASIFAGPAAPFAASVGMGIGALAGTAVDLWIRHGNEHLSTMEAKIQMGIAFAIGFATGYATQGQAVYIANEVGRKAIASPQIYSYLSKALQAGPDDIYLRKTIDVAKFYVPRPQLFTRKVLEWISSDLASSVGVGKTVWLIATSGEITIESAKEIGGLITDGMKLVDALIAEYRIGGES